MAGNDRPVLVSPSSSHGVEVGAADTASDNLDVDIAVAEGFGLELHSRCCQNAPRGWQDCPGLFHTSCLLGLFHWSAEWTANPSKVSGYMV